MPEPTPIAPAALVKPVVLVVDDEDDILESLTAVLEEFLPEARILAARSALVAQDLMKRAPPDVVVADFRMPGMNGLEFLSEIRDSTNNVTRIMMTAYPAIGLVVRAVNEARIQGLYIKPFDAMRMVEAIRQALKERQAAAS